MKNNTNSRKYWWFLVLIIPCLLFYELSKNQIIDDHYEKNKERKAKLEGIWIDNSIKNINTNQIYILKNESGFSDDGVIGIKIDKIFNDSLVVKKIKISKGFQGYYGAIVLDYNSHKDLAPSFTISKNVFSSYNSKSNYFPTLDFLKSDKKYKLQSIYELDVPFLSIDNTNLDNQKEIKNLTGNIFIGNFGKSGKIISIKNKKGNVQWIDTFPVSFNTDEYFRKAAIKLQLRNYDSDLGSVSEFIILDSLGKQQIYNFEMQGIKTEIYRIK